LNVTRAITGKQWVLAAAAALALVVSACGSTIAKPVARASGGTVTFAQEIGAPPTYIFPLEDGAESGNNNITYLQPEMWRPLYWFGHANSQLPTINYSLSLANAPVWSNGGKTATITLKSYRWSNGSMVTSRDVELWMNLLKANAADYVGYAAGWWVDQITSMDFSSPTQFSLTFDGAYSSTWLLDNGLSEITPIPQYAWDPTPSTTS